MATPSPGRYDGGGSSSAVPNRQQQGVIDEFDGDESADLGQENAVLADDPLDDIQERIP